MKHADEFPVHAQPTCSDEQPINATPVGSGCWRCNALALDRLAELESTAAYAAPGNFIPSMGSVVYVRQADLDADVDTFIASHTRGGGERTVPMYVKPPAAPLGWRKALMGLKDVLVAFAGLSNEQMDPAAWEQAGAHAKTQAAIDALATPAAIPEPLLRQAFETLNKGRNLTRSATTGTYTNSTTAAMWKQHVLTAEWATK